MSVSGVLVAVSVFYFSLLAALFIGQRSFLYHPDTNLEAPARYGVPQFQILTDENRENLAHWYGAPSNKGFPVIVLFHGNAGHVGYRAYKAKIFMEQGYGVLLTGYSGFGSNAGSPSEQSLYADGRSALRMVKAAGIDQKTVIL